MKFIEVTRNKVKTMVNCSQIIHYYPNKDNCRIVLNRINDGSSVIITVSETYDEVKKLILNAKTLT